MATRGKGINLLDRSSVLGVKCKSYEKMEIVTQKLATQKMVVIIWRFYYAKKKIRTTERKINQFLKELCGQGEGKEYVPWIKVGEYSALGILRGRMDTAEYK